MNQINAFLVTLSQGTILQLDDSAPNSCGGPVGVTKVDNFDNFEIFKSF